MVFQTCFISNEWMAEAEHVPLCCVVVRIVLIYAWYRLITRSGTGSNPLIGLDTTQGLWIPPTPFRGPGYHQVLTRGLGYTMKWPWIHHSGALDTAKCSQEFLDTPFRGPEYRQVLTRDLSHNIKGSWIPPRAHQGHWAYGHWAHRSETLDTTQSSPGTLGLWAHRSGTLDTTQSSPGTLGLWAHRSGTLDTAKCSQETLDTPFRGPGYRQVLTRDLGYTMKGPCVPQVLTRDLSHNIKGSW